MPDPIPCEPSAVRFDPPPEHPGRDPRRWAKVELVVAALLLTGLLALLLCGVVDEHPHSG